MLTERIVSLAQVRGSVKSENAAVSDAGEAFHFQTASSIPSNAELGLADILSQVLA